MSAAAIFDDDPLPHLSPFESVFIRTVLEHRGVGARPSLADFTAALDHLAQACRGVLYLEALTQEDWRDNVDQKRTDNAVHLRPVKRYRRELKARGFVAIGGGLFVAESSPVLS